MRTVPDRFFPGRLSHWQAKAAELTWFFHWSPRDAWGLTMSELAWWRAQASRINVLRAGGDGK
ncbi:hypothetical protein C7B16_10730 [Escherichia sp. 20412-1]|nr:hypothetical protein C7B16_10730 [Escherichia sp. 20412-1]